MSTLLITVPELDAGSACWAFLQGKKALMAARGHDCSVSHHSDRLSGGRRFCLSWIPHIDQPHPSVSRASRNYVLELTLCERGRLLFSYSGCGIDTQETQRAINATPSLERELESLFLEFEATSQFIHHMWFVSPPNSPRTGWHRGRA